MKRRILFKRIGRGRCRGAADASGEGGIGREGWREGWRGRVGGKRESEGERGMGAERVGVSLSVMGMRIVVTHTHRRK